MAKVIIYKPSKRNRTIIKEKNYTYNLSIRKLQSILNIRGAVMFLNNSRFEELDYSLKKNDILFVFIN